MVDERIRELERQLLGGDRSVLPALYAARRRLREAVYTPETWPWPLEGESFPLKPFKRRWTADGPAIQGAHRIRPKQDILWLVAEEAPPDVRSWELEDPPLLAVCAFMADGAEFHKCYTNSFRRGLPSGPKGDGLAAIQRSVWLNLQLQGLSGTPIDWFGRDTFVGADSVTVRKSVEVELAWFVRTHGLQSAVQEAFAAYLAKSVQYSEFPFEAIRLAREVDPGAFPNMLAEDGPGPRRIPAAFQVDPPTRGDWELRAY